MDSKFNHVELICFAKTASNIFSHFLLDSIKIISTLNLYSRISKIQKYILKIQFQIENISEIGKLSEIFRFLSFTHARDFDHVALRYAQIQSSFSSSILIQVQRSKPEFCEIKIFGWSFWTLCKKVIKFKKSRNRWRLFRVQINVKYAYSAIWLGESSTNQMFCTWYLHFLATRIFGYFELKMYCGQKTAFLI